MTLDELTVVIGAKIEHGDFQDVFAVVDHIKEAFEKVGERIKEAFEKGFEVTDKVATAHMAMRRLAETYGMTVDEVEQLGWAAKATGTDINTLMVGMRYLSKSAGDAVDGGKKAAKSMSGIAAKDTQGHLSGMIDLLEDAADKMTKLPAGAERLNLARSLFGRSAGAELVPLLSKGVEGIRHLREQFEASGAALSEVYSAMTPAYKAAKNNIDLMTEALETRFAGRNIEKQTHLWESLNRILASKGLHRAIDMLSRAFGVMVRALTFVSDAVAKFLNGPVGRVEFILFALSAAFTATALAAVAAVAPMIGGAIAVAASWALASLPILLIAGLLVLLVDEIYTFIEGGDSMLGRIKAWSEAIDPNDNTILSMFKKWVSYLMDVKDLINYISGKERKAGPIPGHVTDIAPNETPEQAAARVGGTYVDVNNPRPEGHGDFMDYLGSLVSGPYAKTAHYFSPTTHPKYTPGLADMTPYGGGASYGPESPAEASFTPTINSTVNVTVPPGSDAHAIGSAVKDAVDEHLKKHIQTAFAAHGGGK